MTVNRGNFDKVNDLRLQSYVCTLTGQGNMQWKDPVAVADDLPTTGNQINDHRWCKDDGFVYKWDGEEWNKVHVPGDGGAENLSQLTDVSLTDLQDGDVLSYDATSEKYKNKAIFNPEITNPKAGEVLTCDENGNWVNQDNKDRIQLEFGNTTAKDYQYDPTRATFEGFIELKAGVTITAKTGYKIGLYDYTSGTSEAFGSWAESYTTVNTGSHRLAIKKDDNAKFTIAELEAIPTTYIEVSDGDYSCFKKERKIPSKWTGKKVVFIGDSITAGSGTDEGYRYYDHLNHYMKFGSMTIEGVGGSCFSNTSDYGNQNSPIAERAISTESKQADLIVVFAGTNDYGHDTPIEDNDFISSATDTGFIGAVRTFVGQMIYENPTAKIVFMTPLHRKNYKNDKTKVDYVANGEGHNLSDYVNAIKKVAQEYSCPVIDSNEIGGFLPRIARNGDLYSTDYLHPNNSGHIMLARNIRNYFELI